MTTLQTIVEGVNALVRVNENFDAISAAGTFGKRAADTTGLTWAYYGGIYGGNTVADDDVALTDDAANYVVVLRSSGVVSVSTATTNWLSTSYARLYKVTAAGGVVTAVEDHRLASNGLLYSIGGAGTGDVVGPGVAVDGHLVQFDGTTGKLVKDGIALDTDGTLAANSDTRVATQKAVKTYVGAAVTGLLDYKGATDCSANPNYPAASKGDAYQVSVAGKIGGGSGTSVDVGDWYIASADNAGGTEAGVGTSWGHIEHNLLGALVAADIGVTLQGYDADLAAIAALAPSNDDILQRKAGAWTNRSMAQLAADLGAGTGDVVGPGVAVDGHLVQFDGTTGKLLKDGIALDTDTTLAANSDTRLATQKAVKTYVSDTVNARSWKDAVRVATTVAGTLASSFENGDTVDGVTLATGNRILIKNQATASENGIYVVAVSGAPARAADADAGAELVNASCYVSEGTTNADTQWTCTANATPTLGSTSLPWVQSGAGNTYSADGSTLQLSGTTFSQKDAGTTNAKLADMANATVKGRNTAGTGVPEDVTMSQLAVLLGQLTKPTECIPIACGDETTAAAAGTGKVTFRMPYAFTVTEVRASATTAPTGGTLLTIDINESGTTILSTKLTFDASEKTTTTAATPAVISDASLADDAEITIDFDSVGSTIAGAGVKVYLIGHRT